ncbi:hypothetical protein NIB75_11120 [Bacteroides uniformis]|nr:hypothetical protein [Bacteroides uniformis]
MPYSLVSRFTFTSGKRRKHFLLFPEKREREADKGGGAQGRAGESLSGHLRGISAPELEEEELAAEIADMYLHGRAYYYSRQTTAGTAERRAHIHQV